MDELRAMHLGAPTPARSVFGELRAAYETVVARKAAGVARADPSPLAGEGVGGADG